MEHPELCPMFQEPHHRRKRSANDDHENDGPSDTKNNEDDTEHSNVGVLALYLLIAMIEINDIFRNIIYPDRS